jgi:WD40 repeat protein
VPLTLVVREAESGRLLLSKPATYPALRPPLGQVPLLSHGLAWSPDSRWLATAGQGTTVQIWEVGRQRLALTYRGHGAAVLAVAWSPNGRWLASASSDGQVQVWQAP